MNRIIPSATLCPAGADSAMSQPMPGDTRPRFSEKDQSCSFSVLTGAASPLSAPVYAAAAMLPVSELPVNIARALPRAFFFWQIVYWLGSGWLVAQLRARRKAMAREVLENRDRSEVT